MKKEHNKQEGHEQTNQDMPALESPLTPPGADMDDRLGTTTYVAVDYFQSHGLLYNVNEAFW
jgi:hypothetical protein